MDAAVPVGTHREPAQGCGISLFGVEQACFVGLADLGCDDVEDPAPQHRQLAGIVGPGVTDQDPLSLGDQPGVEVRGQVSQGIEDHLGLIQLDLARRERGPGDLTGREPRRGPQVAVSDPASRPGLDRPPGRGRGRTARSLDPDRLGMGGEPELELCDLRRQAGHLDQRFTSSLRTHRPPRLIGRLRDLATQPTDHVEDRVRRTRSAVGLIGGHRSRQAPTTDSSDRPGALSPGRGQRTGTVSRSSYGEVVGGRVAASTRRAGVVSSPR